MFLFFCPSTDTRQVTFCQRSQVNFKVTIFFAIILPDPIIEVEPGMKIAWPSRIYPEVNDLFAFSNQFGISLIVPGSDKVIGRKNISAHKSNTEYWSSDSLRKDIY